MPFRRLATTLALSMALLSLVGLGAMTGLAAWRSSEALRKRALATNEAITIATAHALDQYVSGALAIVQEAAGRPKLHQEILRRNWPEAEVVLRNITQHFPQFEYVFVQDPQGFIRAWVPGGQSVGEDFSSRPFFQAARDTRQPVVSDVHVSGAAQRPVVVVAAPVLEDGPLTVAGVLVGGLRLEALTRVASRPAGDVERAVLIVDRRGVAVNEPHLAGQPPVPTPHPVGRLVAATPRPSGVIEEPATGASLLTARAPVGTLGWTVVTTTPTRAVGAPARELTWALVLLGVACTAGAAGLSIALARSLTRPLADLTATAGRLAEGDLEARVAPRGRDEVATLGAAFNRMAAAMAGSHRALADHTAELERGAHRLTREVAERDRAQAEASGRAERLAILHRVDQAILAAESPQAIAEGAIRHLRRLVRARRVSVALYDFTAGQATWLAVDGAGATGLSAGRSIPLELMGDRAALARGEVQVVEVAVLTHEEVTRALSAEGVRSYAVVPLRARGNLIGSVNFGVGHSGGPPAEDVAVAREVADQLAIAIQQGRLYAELERHASELEDRVATRTAELAAASRAVARASRAKTEFLSRMSHELRTPLNVILGFGALLEMDRLPPDQEDSVHQILRAGRHLLGLINEVLDISRIEAGHLRLSLEPVRLGEALRDALSLIAPLAAQRQVTLRPADDADGHYLLADRQRLQQVLLNLLSNAVKYNRPGGWVTVACRPGADRRLLVAVQDSGWGMTEEQLGRLFTPFDRLGAEQRDTVEGTGLGLALTRHLVEAMGGSLSVTSVPDQGSTFVVELAAAESPGDATMEAGPEPAMAGAAGLTVLYVEDNLPNLHLVEKLMARRPGTRLISAIQGRVGLDLARQHRPDVVLLDRHLPDLPGDEVLRLLRADARTARVPVVILSADATPGEVQRLRAAGAHAYLTKPLDVAALFGLLDQIAAQKETSRHG
jgi:signal transduction histidine kinase/ActR/RegA family two-component response regulator